LKPFYINPDITQAETLPSSFYRSEEIFNLLIEKVFAKTWQFAGDTTSFLFSGVCTRGAYAPNKFGWAAILYIQRLHPPWEYSLPQSE